MSEVTQAQTHGLGFRTKKTQLSTVATESYSVGRQSYTVGQVRGGVRLPAYRILQRRPAPLVAPPTALRLASSRRRRPLAGHSFVRDHAIAGCDGEDPSKGVDISGVRGLPEREADPRDGALPGG